MSIGQRELLCWRALATLLSTQEALKMPWQTIDSVPVDPRLWRDVRPSLARALEQGDLAAVVEGTQFVIDAADDAWRDGVRWDGEDTPETAEFRRRKDDSDLVRALDRPIPSELDALSLARRGLEAIRPELGSKVASSALEEVSRGSMARVGWLLLRRSLQVMGELGGAPQRRKQQRIEVLWTFLVPVLHTDDRQPPPRDLLAPMAAAVQLLEGGWPPPPEPRPPTVELPDDAPGLSGSDLLWPLVRRAHKSDWVSWRSDLPEEQALMAAASARLPELLVGVTELVLAPDGYGLGRERRTDMLRALAALATKRFGPQARFVMTSNSVDRLAELLSTTTESVPSWLRDSLQEAVRRSRRTLETARCALLDELLSPQR